MTGIKPLHGDIILAFKGHNVKDKWNINCPHPSQTVEGHQ